MLFRTQDSDVAFSLRNALHKSPLVSLSPVSLSIVNESVISSLLIFFFYYLEQN